MAVPAYNYGTSPTAIAATASEALYTALQYAQDNPQLRRQLMSKHGMQKTFYAMMKELGLGSPVSGPTFSHYEQDWIINNFLVGTVVTASTGAGTNVVVALDPTSMYTTTVDGITSTYSYPAQWDIIKLVDGSEAQIINKDVTVNPHQLTIRPRLTTNNLATKIVAAGRYWISTNSFGEGTFGATPKTPRTFRYSGNTQIIKSAYVETGSAMTDKLPIASLEGKEGSMSVVLGTPAMEALQMDRISKALLFSVPGDGNVTVTSNATGTQVINRTTQGLDDYVTKNGTIYNYTKGAMTLDDIDGFGVIFNRERVQTKDLLVLGAYGLRVQLENTLKTYMNNTSFMYAKDNAAFKTALFDEYSSPEDFFLWLGFAGFHKGGFNYLLRTVSELDEIQGAGTTGYNWDSQGWILPVAMFKNQGGNKNMLPMAGYRYKELAGYNREWELGTTGGAGNFAKTSSLDAQAIDLRSDIGAEWGLGNQMIKIIGA
jgi:hypothetical protein